MRVLHVITKGDVGGAQTHVVELTGAQVRAGMHVSVIAGTDGPALERCRAAGCEVAVLPSLGAARSQLWQRSALRDLDSAITAAAPDIVHAHSSNAGLLARVVCHRRHLPCVYTAHGWPFQRGAPWRQRVLSFGGEFAGGRLGDAVICLTDVEAARARRARVVAADRLWIVPNGLADVPDTHVRHHHAGPARLVMVARFAPPKQQRRLLEVMSAIDDLPWTLTFVGDGPELEDCRRAADRIGSERIDFAGHRDDVPAVLAEHDVLVLWSTYEGLPISVLEGMRAGLCCVASDLPGVRSLFGDPSCGLVAGDDADLADALRRVLRDPDLRRSLGLAARERFLAAFSSSAMEASIARIYAEVLARARG